MNVRFDLMRPAPTVDIEATRPDLGAVDPLPEVDASVMRRVPAREPTPARQPSPSMVEAALRLEAGLRGATLEVEEEAAAALQEPEDAVNLQALDFHRVLVRDHTFGALLVLAVGVCVLMAGVGDALWAALVMAVLHAWYAKGLAMHEAWHIRGRSEERAQADKEFGGALLRAGGAVLLVVFILWLLGVSGSEEQPVPEPVALEYISNSSYICSATCHSYNCSATCHEHHLLGNEFCLWRWKAFSCSTGCKLRMHWPGLQRACTPM